MKIFSGTSNKPLAEQIARAMDTQLSPIEIFVFPDGEKRIQIQDNVVDEDTVVVQSTSTPAAENFMELFFIIDGLKRSGAKSITVVVPYLGYQRQDHVFRTGEAVSLDVVVHALEGAGVDRVIVFDLHSIKIPEVFSIPVGHLSALPLFTEKIKQIEGAGRDKGDTGDRGDEQTFGSSVPFGSSSTSGFLVSPDMGGLRRISKMSELLNGMPWIATVKDRDLDTGNIVMSGIEGDASVIAKTAFMVDDMISSGKTIVEAAKLLKDKGVEEIYVFVTHPVFSDEAPKILQESAVTKVFVTDSVDVPEAKRFEKLEILSIANLVSVELQAKS